MKTFWTGAGCVILAFAPSASGQTLGDQKLEAEIAKLKVETEKAKVDTEKSRIDADNALFSTLRGTSGGTAAVTGGEKTAEGLLLSKASLAGASANIVALLPDAGFPASADIKPVVVWGNTPPSVAQWILFKEEREKIEKQLKAASADWVSSKGTKMAFLPAAAAIATLVATVIPIFKTDTTLAGGTVSIEESDARASLGAALQTKGYGALASLGVTDGAALADELLSPIKSEYDAARAAYEDEYLVYFDGRLSKGRQSDKIKAAAAKLKAALDAYKGLRGQLLADTGGIVTATVIDRQRLLHGSAAKHPIIYLLNVDAAYTSTTKKGMFTGLGGKVPAFGSVSTIIDFAIAGPAGEKRGTSSCTIANRPMKNLLLLQPATFAVQGSALCDLPPG